MVKEIQVPTYLCESCDKRYDDKRHAEDHERRLASKTKPFAYEIGQEPLWVRTQFGEGFPLKVRIKGRLRNDDHVNRYDLEVADLESIPERYRNSTSVEALNLMLARYHERHISTKEPKRKTPTNKSTASQ